MSPQYGATRSAHIEATPAEPPAETGSAVAPVEQFIWEDASAQVETAATDDDEALTRIVVLSEDEEEEQTGDSWRRQLISALQDSDRDGSHTKAHPTEPPPIPPAEIPRRPPIVLVGNHARATAPLPVERRPRHRMRPVLFGISAAAGLLTIALPRATNAPESLAEAATSMPITTGSLVPAAGEAELKPIIVNSPVLVRDSMFAKSAPAVPVGPVIETVRTVPVQIGARPPMPAQTSELAPAVEQPASPLATARPPPAPPALPSLDRDGVAALIANKSAAVVEPPAAAPSPVAPTSAAPKEKAASAAPEVGKPAKTRNPQVSTAYQRSIREKPHTKSASKKRAPTKTAARSSDKAKWDARRQGLGTSTQVKEVEPSTMVKLLKSLNPFGSKEEPQTTNSSSKNIFR